MKEFGTVVRFGLLACLALVALTARPVSAEQRAGNPHCESLYSNGASVHFTLHMPIENRRIPMEVPEVYFEDRWDLVDGAEHKAQLFSLDFATLRPLTRIEQHELNKRRQLKLLQVLLHDTVNPETRLRYAISEAQGWRVDENSTDPIETTEFGHGLEEVDLGGARYDRVFFGRSTSQHSPNSIICDGERPVPNKICRHYFRSNEGIDVDLTYPMAELPAWKQTQDRVQDLIGCFVTNENGMD